MTYSSLDISRFLSSCFSIVYKHIIRQHPCSSTVAWLAHQPLTAKLARNLHMRIPRVALFTEKARTPVRTKTVAAGSLSPVTQ